MGRPPLHLLTTTVRLPEATLKRIDALLGEHRRSAFIREAVEAELARREEPEPQTKPQQHLRKITVPKGIKVKREMLFSTTDADAAPLRMPRAPVGSLAKGKKK